MGLAILAGFGTRGIVLFSLSAAARTGPLSPRPLDCEPAGALLAKRDEMMANPPQSLSRLAHGYVGVVVLAPYCPIDVQDCWTLLKYPGRACASMALPPHDHACRTFHIIYLAPSSSLQILEDPMSPTCQMP